MSFLISLPLSLFQVAALAHTPSLSYLSVGLADGTVLLLRGLDSALMSAPSSSTSSTIPAVSLPKFKVVFEPPTASTSSNQVPHEPITALGFSEVSPPNQRTSTEVIKTSKSNATSNPRKTGGRNITNVKDAIQPPIKPSSTTPASVHLFIVTLSRILRYTVHGKGAGSAPTVVDDVGCALGCAAVVPSFSSLATSTNLPGDTTGPPSQGALAGKMVVAREEAIYVVGAEGREACFAFEGEITRRRSFDKTKYLLLEMLNRSSSPLASRSSRFQVFSPTLILSSSHRLSTDRSHCSLDFCHSSKLRCR